MVGNVMSFGQVDGRYIRSTAERGVKAMMCFLLFFQLLIGACLVSLYSDGLLMVWRNEIGPEVANPIAFMVKHTLLEMGLVWCFVLSFGVLALYYRALGTFEPAMRFCSGEPSQGLAKLFGFPAHDDGAIGDHLLLMDEVRRGAWRAVWVGAFALAATAMTASSVPVWACIALVMSFYYERAFAGRFDRVYREAKVYRAMLLSRHSVAIEVK